MRRPGQCAQFPGGPLLRRVADKTVEPNLDGVERCGIGELNWRVAVADSLCVALIVLLVAVCVAMRIGNAVLIVMVVLPVCDWSTEMRHLMRNGCARGHREHEGRGKHEKHRLEFAQNQDGTA